MARERRLRSDTIAEKVRQRYASELLELRSKVERHTEAPTPADQVTGRAVSQPGLTITVQASTITLTHDPQRPVTERRVRVTAFDSANHRVPVRPAEAQGWARAVLGEPLVPVTYHHQQAATLVGVDQPRAAEFVAYLNDTGAIPRPATLPFAADLKPIPH